MTARFSGLGAIVFSKVASVVDALSYCPSMNCKFAIVIVGINEPGNRLAATSATLRASPTFPCAVSALTRLDHTFGRVESLAIWRRSVPSASAGWRRSSSTTAELLSAM